MVYARQDRKTSGREAITAKLVADLLTTAGANRVLAMDLHTGQIQGFFNILVDHIFATPILVNYIKSLNMNPDDMVAVSPDTGGVQRTRHFAKSIGCPLAIIDKRRDKHNEAIASHVTVISKTKSALCSTILLTRQEQFAKHQNFLKEKVQKMFTVCAAHRFSPARPSKGLLTLQSKNAL